MSDLLDPSSSIIPVALSKPSIISLTCRTTFVSAVFATLNSLSLQEYVARWISDYMTSETGVTVM